jgi:protein-S-isoprenylcysteine O-methyltransferase Ste14
MNWPALARRIRVPLGFAFAGLYFWLAQPAWWSVVLGTLIVIPGLWLRALAAGHVRKSAEITASGPYGYTRNPLYFGSLIIAAGFSIASRSWWVALAIVALFALIYYPVIHWEEKYLRANFPEYATYSAAVPRFFPGRPAVTVSGSFSRELYVKHREYNAVIGSAAMFGALIIKMIWFNR